MFLLNPDQVLSVFFTSYLINNLWVVIAAVLVFMMTIAVGFLEIGELGNDFSHSLLKTIAISATALFVMAIVGFNTAFAPTRTDSRFRLSGMFQTRWTTLTTIHL